MDNTHQYDDIIHLPHHVSSRHPRMSAAQRAMQFASYKALAGYEDMIEETGRLTDSRPDLNEDQKETLDRTLQILLSSPEHRTNPEQMHESSEDVSSSDSGAPLIAVTWFCPDERKDGGALRTDRGYLKQSDSLRRTLTLLPETANPSAPSESGPLQIPLDDICEIEIL